MSYQVLEMILPLITIPYVSRILGPTGIGINAYTNSIVSYFIIFGSIGIATYGNREIAYNQENKVKRSQIFWEISILRFITIMVAFLAFLGYLTITKQYRDILLIQSLAIVAAAFDISWYFMGMEDFKRTVIRNTMVKVISLILLFTLVHKPSDLWIYVLILTGSVLVGNLSLWPYLKERVKLPDIHKLNLYRHLRPSLMLFLPQVAMQIYLVVNKTMVGALDSVTAAGFFSQADTLVRVVLSIVTSLGVVLMPRMANMHATGDDDGMKRYIYKSFNYITALAAPLMFGTAGIALSFAPYFFGKSFNEVGLLMMVEAPVIVLIAWTNVIGMQYLLPINKTKEFTISVTIGAVINIALNPFLILNIGVIGATIATVFSELGVTSYLLWVVRNELSLTKLMADVWKYLISGAAMFIGVYTLNQLLDAKALAFAFQIITGVVIYALGVVVLKPSVFDEIKKYITKSEKKRIN